MARRQLVSFARTSFIVLAIGVCCTLPGPFAMADTQKTDLELVVEAVRELFPEIESQTRIRGKTGSAFRLEAPVSFSKARERILSAVESVRRMAGGSTLDDILDNWRNGHIEAIVRVRGGWAVGGFRLDRKGMDIVIEVFAASVRDDRARLPARPVIPEPLMFLFPL